MAAIMRHEKDTRAAQPSKDQKQEAKWERSTRRAAGHDQGELQEETIENVGGDPVVELTELIRAGGGGRARWWTRYLI